MFFALLEWFRASVVSQTETAREGYYASNIAAESLLRALELAARNSQSKGSKESSPIFWAGLDGGTTFI